MIYKFLLVIYLLPDFNDLPSLGQNKSMGYGLHFVHMEGLLTGHKNDSGWNQARNFKINVVPTLWEKTQYLSANRLLLPGSSELLFTIFYVQDS